MNLRSADRWSAEARSQLEALAAPIGRELLDRLDRLAQLKVTPATELRVGARLRRDYPTELVTAALGQHELRRRAEGKFTRAQRMYFTRAGLEQATAEIIARHRATRFAGASRVADLCCGIGGDLIALAECREVVAVDRDPLHLRMAALNADVYEVGDAVTAVHADVREADLSSVDAVFVDPARRARGHRMRPGASEPPLSWSTSLVDRVEAVGIKAAPGIARDTVPAGSSTCRNPLVDRRTARVHIRNRCHPRRKLASNVVHRDSVDWREFPGSHFPCVPALNRPDRGRVRRVG